MAETGPDRSDTRDSDGADDSGAPGGTAGETGTAMLRDAVRRLLMRHWRVPALASDAIDPESLLGTWQRLAEQGLAQIGVDETSGGLSLAVAAQEELGGAGCTAPLAACVTLNLARLAARGTPLESMQQGQAWVAMSFAQADPDANAGRLTVADHRVSGWVDFVEHADVASHLALIVPGPALAFVRMAGPDPASCTLEPAPSFGAPGAWRVRLQDAPAFLVPLSDARLSVMLMHARLLHVARACGAARRALDMAITHARERVQFGRPIGAFQAIQHKLADVHIAITATHLTLHHAAREADRQSEHWQQFAWCACVMAADTLRNAALQLHHTFGAIGYSEEHAMARHFRCIHLDVMRLGGLLAGGEALAAWWLDAPDRRLPSSDLGASGNAFRAEVERWLQTHWNEGHRAAQAALGHDRRDYDPHFARALGRTGWLGLGWPERFGGQGRGPWEQLAFMEAMERADAPRAGAPVQAALLQVHGTPEQQARLLPEILRGEAIYGMGYSEPQAGSDLAALRTRAVALPPEQGGGWRIDGQKIWTTTYWGRYMLLATRTSPSAEPRHAGITLFIVPMDTPGITIRTSRTLYGGTFANVFYDGVRLPDTARLGAVGAGWQALTQALAAERGYIGGGIVLKVARSFELLCDRLRVPDADGRRLADDPRVRERVGRLAAQIEAGRQLMLHCAQRVTDGVTPPEDAAVSKVWSGELMERFGEAAMEMLGLAGSLSEGSPGSILAGRLEQQLRHSLMWVISIGTNEIQRSLIAQRGLGLPR